MTRAILDVKGNPRDKNQYPWNKSQQNPEQREDSILSTILTNRP